MELLLTPPNCIFVRDMFKFGDTKKRCLCPVSVSGVLMVKNVGSACLLVVRATFKPSFPVFVCLSRITWHKVLKIPDENGSWR